ncbi:hypothetical protein C8N43_0061 [Litoreibacter ponti]|uniref:Secreted protein n=1 Tax=Litoreibacter ponti TaxID=1510457 RepID=A0A2T6BH98_9RHOB|nr:DUF1223 domain-containing protein [Litoreibacter ponti]PTX55427.1 hypothetical protein C8N43_0061 [Litoreibacter ponti]
MLKRLTAAALAALVLTPATEATAGGPVVVELYTSQGCSSCPPADALLGELAEREDVIALSLHVDYWDYLGWVDAFADPAYTARQRAYAKAAGSTMIYTPQMVIGGRDQIVGTKAMKLAAHIDKHKAQANPVDLKLARAGDTLEIEAVPAANVPRGMVIFLVRYTPQQSVKIKRGENAGQDLTYHNVVDSFMAIGKWDGGKPLSITADAPGETPAVVIIQDGASGPILAAARVD